MTEAVKDDAERQSLSNAGLDMPTCPYCKTNMQAMMYVGYYESFSYWGCNCDDLPNPHKWNGSYV